MFFEKSYISVEVKVHLFHVFLLLAFGSLDVSKYKPDTSIDLSDSFGGIITWLLTFEVITNLICIWSPSPPFWVWMRFLCFILLSIFCNRCTWMDLVLSWIILLTVFVVSFYSCVCKWNFSRTVDLIDLCSATALLTLSARSRLIINFVDICVYFKCILILVLNRLLSSSIKLFIITF